jgi:hypothetical protein
MGMRSDADDQLRSARAGSDAGVLTRQVTQRQRKPRGLTVGESWCLRGRSMFSEYLRRESGCGKEAWGWVVAAASAVIIRSVS